MHQKNIPTLNRTQSTNIKLNNDNLHKTALVLITSIRKNIEQNIPEIFSRCIIMQL